MQEWLKFEPHTKNYTDAGIFEKNAFLRPHILEKWHFRDNQIPNNMAFLKPLYTKNHFPNDPHTKKCHFLRSPPTKMGFFETASKSNVHPIFLIE